MDILKTILQGAIGGITFGMYHHYVSMKMIEENNEIQKKMTSEAETSEAERKYADTHSTIQNEKMN